MKMADSKPKLRWFQFSLRTLLIFVTVCAIPCSWVTVKKQEVSRQRKVMAAIETLGGRVTWDSTPWGPVWLGFLLGDDFYGHIAGVDFGHCWKVGNSDLHCLDGLDQLKTLSLHRTKVTDAGLQNIEGLTHLEELDITSTRITDAGLEHIQRLKKLRRLRLGDGVHPSSIYDDEQVGKITDAGLLHLKELSELEELLVDQLGITDAGLEHLAELKSLKLLRLPGYAGGEEGFEVFQKAVPNCKISPSAF